MAETNRSDFTPPALQMERHFYTDISIQISRDIPKDALNDLDVFENEYTVDANFLINDNDPTAHQVEMVIASKKTDDVKAYNISLTTVGLFRFAEDCPEEQMANIITVLGPTLLYSAAREFLCTVTSRGPYPPVYLPTTTFIPKGTENGEISCSDPAKE